MMLHRRLDHIRDLKVSDLLREEFCDRELIRRVEDDRNGSARFSCISRECQAAEILIKSIVGISQNSKIYISADYIENNSVKALRPSFESR